MKAVAHKNKRIRGHVRDEKKNVNDLNVFLLSAVVVAFELLLYAYVTIVTAMILLVIIDICCRSIDLVD